MNVSTIAKQVIGRNRPLVDSSNSEKLNTLLKELDYNFFKACEMEYLKQQGAIACNSKSYARGKRCPLKVSDHNYFIANIVILMILANCDPVASTCFIVEGMNSCAFCDTNEPFVDARLDVCNIVLTDDGVYRCSACSEPFAVKIGNFYMEDAFRVCPHEFEAYDVETPTPTCNFCGVIRLS